MMRNSPVLIVAAALAVASCGAATPVAPSAVAGSAVAASSAGGASVLHGDFSTPSGAGRRVVTLHAVQTPSGVVNGGYRIDFTATNVFIEVTATCLVTEGNTAWVGGTISATNSPAIVVGSVSYFYAIDNGKVNDGLSPDVVSTARINDAQGRDIEFCTLKLLQLPRLVGLEGDVSVK